MPEPVAPARPTLGPALDAYLDAVTAALELPGPRGRASGDFESGWSSR